MVDKGRRREEERELAHFLLYRSGCKEGNGE